MAGRRFWHFVLSLVGSGCRRVRALGALPRCWSSSLRPPHPQPLLPCATSLQALMVHIGGTTCGALSLSPLLAVTALSPPSLIINLAYLRHTPYGGPVAPWRDDGDRFLDGWRLCSIHLFCETTFHLSSPHLFYPNPYPTTPLDVGCTSPPFPNATGTRVPAQG